MKNNKIKPSVKVALASTLVATSTVAIAYAIPQITKGNVENTESKLILDVKNIDGDTVKVSIDNIEDIPKALQFKLKLDGAVLKEANGKPVIRDLVVKDESSTIITDYSYDRDNNVIDVLITAEDYIPKVGNGIDIFELDVELDSKNDTRKYSILPEENTQYKYVSNTNKEYVKGVSAINKELALNTAPVIENNNEGYIEIDEEEVLTLTKESLENKGVIIRDNENDDITLEVKDRDDKVIKEFKSSDSGIYDLYITATDSFGEKSETLKVQVKVNETTQGPTITKDGKPLEDVYLEAGAVYDLMSGIKAVDVNGKTVTVTVKSDKNVDLDPESDSEYTIIYTAIDDKGRETIEEIKLNVKANKAPIIKGVEDHVLTVGEAFNPKEGVTVEDEDDNIELVITGNVNTNIPDVYKLIYSATDSGNKTTTVQSIVVVNPKFESMNSVPEINAKDKIIQLGEEFDELKDVTATDKEDGPISEINVLRNDVINNKPGKYAVTYSVTDKQGATATKTIYVIVNDPPKINAEDKTIKLGQDFDPLAGVTATDTEDGTISKITVDYNNVNTDVEGDYKITYSVIDNYGGKTTKTINVKVRRDIVLADSITINNKIKNLYIGSSKVFSATINKEAEIKDIQWTTSDEEIASIEVVGNDVKVIAKSEGEVTITAKTTDGSNKSDSFTIDVLKYEDKIPEFVGDIIDTEIVVPVLGEGTLASPLEMEVKNISVEKFNEFLEELKELNPTLEKKYNDGNFTVYRISLERKANFLKIFGLNKSSEISYIEIRVENTLDNASDLKEELEKVLKTSEQPDKGDGSGDTNKPGQGGADEEDNNKPSQGQEEEDKNPTKPGQGEIDKEDNTNSLDTNSNLNKLPITGGKTMIGYAIAGFTSVLAGVSIFKNKKKKR